jgi:hypothetical protein
MTEDAAIMNLRKAVSCGRVDRAQVRRLLDMAVEEARKPGESLAKAYERLAFPRQSAPFSKCVLGPEDTLIAELAKLERELTAGRPIS